jgi:hypothetical protein
MTWASEWIARNTQVAHDKRSDGRMYRRERLIREKGRQENVERKRRDDAEDLKSHRDAILRGNEDRTGTDC